MKKWSNIWPFLGAILLFICNADWVLAPVLGSITNSFWSQFFILAPIANLELIGWYRFWRWFFTSFLPERKKIRETIDFTKEVAHELKVRGYADRFIEHFEKTFEWAVNPERNLFRIVKAWGHLGMFFLGLEPFVAGGRLVGVIFCATTGWRNGIFSLILGNTIHVLVTIGSWGLIFYLWEEHKGKFFVCAIFFILFLARGFIAKKLRGAK